MAKLKTIKEAINEVTNYIEDRRLGKVKSLITGFPKLDKTMIDGIEWGSVVTIGGRPSVGKSTVSDCIVDGAFANNLIDGKPSFIMLDFNWELASRVILLRRLSSKLKKSYKYILSADSNTVSAGEFKYMIELLENHYGQLPITYCEEPLSVKELGKTVRDFCRENEGKKILIRIDHTLLTKMLSSEGGQVQMLLNLLMEINSIKKEFPVIFLLLTQINREFEERQDNSSDKAFPRQSDVYGGRLNKNSHNN